VQFSQPLNVLFGFDAARAKQKIELGQLIGRLEPQRRRNPRILRDKSDLEIPCGLL
jgi:hypothetical protein